MGYIVFAQITLDLLAYNHTHVMLAFLENLMPTPELAAIVGDRNKAHWPAHLVVLLGDAGEV